MQPDSVSLEDYVVIATYKTGQPELYHKLYCGWLERWGMFGRSNERYADSNYDWELLQADEEHQYAEAWLEEDDMLIPDAHGVVLTGWWYDGHY